MATPHVSDAEVAVAAASAGAAVVRARFGTRLTRVDKGASDFATDADIAAEEAILEVLRDFRPADAVHGEELGQSKTGSGERTWLVDPLCGTLNFAAQTPIMAVNVALRGRAGIEAAACADPVLNEVFWTDGHAAYRRDERVDSPLRPSANSGLVDVNLDPPHPNGDDFRAAAMLSDPAFTAAFRPRVLSTTLALAWVAAGRRAAYVTDGDLHDSVHFSAPIALCQAAGCFVTGLQGQPLHTGVGGLIAAADNETHTALIDIIGRQFAGREAQPGL